MPFWIAYADGAGDKNAATEVQLNPAPGKVEYPPLANVVVETLAGTSVSQRAVADGRVRSWIWEGYPGWWIRTQNMWAQLEPLGARYRLAAGDATPYVYLKEDETKMLRTVSVVGTTITEVFPWLRCRVVGVTRTFSAQRSSLVIYDEIRVDFVIDDPAYNDFG